MANDIIIKIDNEQVHGLTLNQPVEEKMRGPVVNAKIKLTIMRKGQDKPIDVAIIRDVIRVQSVRSHTEGDGDAGHARLGAQGVGVSGAIDGLAWQPSASKGGSPLAGQAVALARPVIMEQVTDRS
jgi:hypothetical protein